MVGDNSLNVEMLSAMKAFSVSSQMTRVGLIQSMRDSPNMGNPCMAALGRLSAWVRYVVKYIYLAAQAFREHYVKLKLFKPTFYGEGMRYFAMYL